jgi:N-methylhydantoinase B
MRVLDLIAYAFSQSEPSKIPAGDYSSVCATIIAGVDQKTKKQFTKIEPQIGGWGAFHNKDGISCNYATFYGETYINPSEVSEARNDV